MGEIPEVKCIGNKMGETPEVKSKNPYLVWSPKEKQTLLRFLVDGVNSNWHDASGSFNKLTVKQRILPELNKICGSAKTYQHYKNRIKILKARYKSFVDLLRYSSGFGWDSKTKKFTATQEVWEDYFKGHPKDKHLCDDSFEDYEDLSMIFGQNTVTGKNAVGLDESTDARIFGTNDNGSEFIPVSLDDDDDDDGVEKLHEQFVSSSLGMKSKEKLPIKKKARTEGSNVEKIVEEIKAATGFSNQIFSMMQQRWEKEVEEKQVEEKNNDVWAAIKEIPDLEENVRFDAMNLVHQMGVKAGFVSITIQERLGWIKHSVLKH